MSPDDIAKDLEAANYAFGSMNIAHQDFLHQARHGKWEKAEELRHVVLALMESQMDLFIRACRATNSMDK